MNERPNFVPSGSEKDRVRRYIERREPVLLLGPTGCGKTTLLTEIATEMGTRFVPVTGGPSLTDGDLLGGYLYSNDAMTWYDGPLVYAVRRGLPFFFDEIGKTPEGALRPLFPLLDARREIHLAGKLGNEPEIVRAAPGFCFMGAYTPREMGSLPEAFLQRCRVVRIDYLPREAEISLLASLAGVDEANARYLVSVAEVLRNGAAERKWRSPSTRSLLLASGALKEGFPREWVVRESLFGPLELTDRDVNAVITTLSAKGLGFQPDAELTESAPLDLGESVDPFDLEPSSSPRISDPDDEPGSSPGTSAQGG